MNIIKSIQAHWRNGQKGAVLVMTAVLLPFLIAFTGFAIDAGNLYYQKSRLQNAADAAALAGAQAYVDSDGNKSTARRVGNRYVNGAYHNLEANEDVEIEHTIKDGKDKNTKYYTVEVKKDVPLHFLAAFVGDSTDVRAHSNAKIMYTPNAPALSAYLFVFKDNFSSVQPINSPDNFGTRGQISASYDGNMIYTEDSYKKLKYSAQSHDDHPLTALLGSRAVKEGLSVNEALSKPQSLYDSSGKNTTGGYWTTASHGTYDYNAFPTWVNNQFIKTNNYDSYDQNQQQMYYDAIEKTPNHLQKYDLNPTLEITREIKGDIDTPVVFQPDGNTSVINVRVEADTRRPVFIYCPKPIQVHIDIKSGVTFRGIVFAPNSDDVLVNNNGGVFSGSIIGKSIDLEAGINSIYRYESFLGGSSGGSSGSSKSTMTASVDLVRDEDM